MLRRASWEPNPGPLQEVSALHFWVSSPATDPSPVFKGHHTLGSSLGDSPCHHHHCNCELLLKGVAQSVALQGLKELNTVHPLGKSEMGTVVLKLGDRNAFLTAEIALALEGDGEKRQPWEQTCSKPPRTPCNGDNTVGFELHECFECYGNSPPFVPVSFNLPPTVSSGVAFGTGRATLPSSRCGTVVDSSSAGDISFSRCREHTARLECEGNRSQ